MASLLMKKRGEDGANIVLFGRDEFEPVIEVFEQSEELEPMLIEAAPGGATQVALRFPVEYIDGSAKLFATRSIEYVHQELSSRSTRTTCSSTTIMRPPAIAAGAEPPRR